MNSFIKLNIFMIWRGFHFLILLFVLNGGNSLEDYQLQNFPIVLSYLL